MAALTITFGATRRSAAYDLEMGAYQHHRKRDLSPHLLKITIRDAQSVAISFSFVGAIE
jgi:hypothetical protein